jgi:hypothetical protein
MAGAVVVGIIEVPNYVTYVVRRGKMVWRSVVFVVRP